jgi:hypothetical protein
VVNCRVVPRNYTAKAKIMRTVVGLTSGLKVSKYHERQTKKKMVLKKSTQTMCIIIII